MRYYVTNNPVILKIVKSEQSKESKPRGAGSARRGHSPLTTDASHPVIPSSEEALNEVCQGAIYVSTEGRNLMPICDAFHDFHATS